MQFFFPQSSLYSGTVFLPSLHYVFFAVPFTRMGQCDRGGKRPYQENAHYRPK